MSDQGLKIRENIANFIAGDGSAAELEDWLETQAWDCEVAEERALLGDALRLLAEYSNGDWTDDELKARLGALSRTYWFVQAPKNAWGTSGSDVILHDQRLAGAGKWRAVESS